MSVEQIRIPIQYGDVAANLAATVQHGNDAAWMIMLHGWGCSRDSFAEAFGRSELAARNVCTLDLLGFGDSDRPHTISYTLAGEAALLPQVADFLQARRVSIVGHSMGGGVGLLAAPLLGARLNKFVSVEGNVGLPNGSVSSMIARLPQQFTRGIVLPGLRLAGLAAPSATARRVDRWLWQADARAMHDLAASISQLDSSELLPAFAALPNAVYLCGARGSRQRSVAPHLAKLGIRTVLIPDAGHVVMLDNPNDFYAALAKV